ncbi:hypothetical protein ARMSODRAFT_659183 [Armillaria solidipes]|uniref:Uncharacterized protein n=1 Tax=Armillaria solidipes TaxID=1076256 RepID=A0A2H3ARR3_9AGAR|nr:hypothetical protein ARMSODRAFT_659183 [Armillaria solidipes]
MDCNTTALSRNLSGHPVVASRVYWSVSKRKTAFFHLVFHGNPPPGLRGSFVDAGKPGRVAEDDAEQSVGFVSGKADDALLVISLCQLRARIWHWCMARAVCVGWQQFYHSMRMSSRDKRLDGRTLLDRATAINQSHYRKRLENAVENMDHKEIPIWDQHDWGCW